MVKLQPSKLIMRVRFPLPAYLNQHARMKKVLSMILLAGVLSGPVYAADVQSVAAMAATSGVSIDALSMAVYEVVKADPQSAVEVFRAVMEKRNGSVTETYAVLRAVLLASPSLESEFVKAASSPQTVGSTLGQQLLETLYSMSQTSAVATTVVQGVVGSSSVGNGVPSAALDAYVPAVPTAPSASPEYTVTPTPPPTSANN